MGNKYIVIASNGIGGAERRFVDIFLGLVDQGYPVFLVIPSFLENLLLEEIDSNYSKNVILINMEKWSLFKFYLYLYFRVIKNSQKNSHFHYPLNPPFFLHLSKKTSFSMSFCHSNITPVISMNSGGLTLQRLSINLADRIDILNETVYLDFINKNPKIKNKCSLTPGGTYIRDLKLSFNSSDNERQEFIFVSRLIKGKGVHEFMELIPIINNYIKQNSSIMPFFIIYGDGPLKDVVIEHTSTLKKIERINVTYAGFSKPGEIFPSSLCVFSLQEATNYPSRVIAEALSYGSNVIVSDTGNSRAFGKIKGLWYLENPSNIEHLLKKIINKRYNPEEISNNAKCVFSNTEYLNYFSVMLG